MISFLVKLQHLPLPSLIVTSSQVRVGTPLPLQLCCISGLGPEGLRHNCTIPVWSPGNLLRVTLTSRGNSASENLRQETQRPKCRLYETPYVAAPIREIGDVIARTPLYAWPPTYAPTRARIYFGSRVTQFSRDPSCQSIGSYVPFLQGSHKQKQYHHRTTLRTWEPWKMQGRDAEWSASNITRHIHGASEPLGTTVAQRLGCTLLQ